MQRILIAASCAALCACGGGSSSDGSLKSGGQTVAQCNSITGPGVVVTPTTDAGCVDCAIGNPDYVADDGARTYATLHIAAALPQQGLAVRSTAPSGTTFPAGSAAGAFLTEQQTRATPSDVTLASGTQIRTYLQGVLQESSLTAKSHSSYVPGNDPSLPDYYAWIETTKPFDAVEFQLYDSNATGEVEDWSVYELCSDGWTTGPTF